MLMLRVLFVALLLAVALPTAVQAQAQDPPAPEPAPAPLTPERFAALDRVATALIPLDRARVSSGDYADARTACRSLDSADLLLNRLRKACNASVKYQKAFDGFIDCSGRRRCLRDVRRTRVAINQLIRRDRDANDAVRAAGLVKDCYSSLRSTRSQVRLLERTHRFLKLAKRVLRSGSRKLSRRLLRQGKSIDRAALKEPSASEARATFREACAPPAD